MDLKKELVTSIVNSDFRHIKYRKIPNSFWGINKKEMFVAKEDYFAFQVMVCYKEAECQYTLDKRDSISFKGLGDRVRLDLKIDYPLEDFFSMKFLGYVSDDDGAIVSDPIIEDRELLVERGIAQCLWVTGKIPESYKNDSCEINIDIFSRKGYEDEIKVETLKVKIDIANISMKDIHKEEDFYLDLWQHPSNWARMYHLELWSNEHFEIIGNYLEELATAGNKVVTAIVSDFCWAGQECYKEETNPSNLFEYNMVSTIKDTNGKFICDFSILDRYIKLALSLGMDEEIDLFGILGVWEKDFSTPLENYNDAIKISYYDQTTSTFKYMKKREELAIYIENLFKHLEEMGWWHKVRIMSDHPVDDKVFEECKSFIEEILDGRKIKFKSAIYSEEVIRKHGEKLDDVSLAFPLSVLLGKDIEKIKKNIKDRNGKTTWYVCFFPEKPNNFISSPLIENILIGWYTYLLGFDGFLRWDFAIWPKDPFSNPSYKKNKWSAGDMFFVYPGANLKPVSSNRWENLKFGIRDFKLLKALEKKGYSRDEILSTIISPLIGSINDIKVLSELSVDIKYEDNYGTYESIKRKMLKMYLDK